MNNPFRFVFIFSLFLRLTFSSPTENDGELIDLELVSEKGILPTQIKELVQVLNHSEIYEVSPSSSSPYEEEQEISGSDFVILPQPNKGFPYFVRITFLKMGDRNPVYKPTTTPPPTINPEVRGQPRFIVKEERSVGDWLSLIFYVTMGFLFVSFLIYFCCNGGCKLQARNANAVPFSVIPITYYPKRDSQYYEQI